MSRRSVLILSTLAVITVAVLAWAFSPAPLAVEVSTVTRGTFIQTVDEDGITRVRDRYIITAPVTGTLLRVQLKPGDFVKPDQVIATIIPSTPELLDPRTRAQLIARRDAAEAHLARAKILVRQSEVRLQQAQLDARRYDELAEQGYVAHVEREQAHLTLEVRQKEFDAARYEADAAYHDVLQSRAAVSRLAEAQRGDDDAGSAWEIHSPVPGSVLRVVHESGGPVTVGETLLEVGDISRLEAVIDVLSTEATRISPKAPVELIAGEGARRSGYVRTVEPHAFTKVSALGVEEQRVNVIVDLEPDVTPRTRIGDGYRVDARIEVARLNDVVLVPVAALFRDGSRWAVFAVVDGRAVKRPVEIGLRNSEHATVKSGLKPGDVVILYPGDAIEEGRRIEPSRQAMTTEPGADT